MSGVVKGMTMLDYLKAPGIAKHALDHFASSPLEYDDYMHGRLPEEKSPEMRFGSLVHSAVLENRQEWVVQPDTYPPDDKPWNGNATFCKQWVEGQTRPILKREEADSILAMMRLVHLDPLAAPLLRSGEPENSMFAIDPATGFPLKSRPDWTTGDCFVELKTTIDASTEAFAKEIERRRYHVQAAMNLRIAKLLGLPQVRWVFLAVQKSNPPRINVRELDPAAIDLGDCIIDDELAAIAECERKGSWPGLSGETGQIEKINVPDWAHKKYADAHGGNELIIGGKAHAL